MLKLIRIECLKTFSKWRTYIGFIALGVLLPLIMLGLKWSGIENFYEWAVRYLKINFIFVGTLFNGYSVSNFIMNSLWVHVPFLISLVAGDVVAGEGAAGTFRIYLTRPVTRAQVMGAKFAGTAIYTFSLIVFMGVVSVGLGLILFGGGDLLVVEKGILIIPAREVLWRFILAYGLAFWVMGVVASVAFLLSTLVNNSIGPIIGTMAILSVFLMISNIPIELFRTIRPYLFTTYFDVWQRAFSDPIPWGEMGRSVLYLGIYILGCFGVSMVIFHRKDILT
ncbi:ABC transporter permease subunit [candidate division KSB1 bacterium]|nr:ABC transporter permease subunit [candidate division KSB1 bacterium]